MTIDVILLTYNRAQYIGRAIKSILNQSYKNLRLIISDDASTDKTEEVVKSFKDKRIYYKKNNKNLGFLDNFKIALSYVNADLWIIIGDDDYFVDMDFFKRAVNFFLMDQELDIIIPKLGIIYNDDNKNVITHDFPFSLECHGLDIVSNFNIYKNYVVFGLMKKKFIKFIINTNFKFDNTTTSNEYVMLFDIFLHAKKIKFVDITTFHWCRYDNLNHVSNKNQNNIYKALESDLSIIKHLYPYLKSKKVNFDYIEMFNKMLLYSFEEITMNYFLSKDDIFIKLLDKIDNNSDIYIYGKGEVGIKLKYFLNKNNINIKYFIDDFKKANDVIRLENIVKCKKNKTIIISSYKNSQIVSILKKIINSNIKNYNVLTLIDNEE